MPTIFNLSRYCCKTQIILIVQRGVCPVSILEVFGKHYLSLAGHLKLFRRRPVVWAVTRTTTTMQFENALRYLGDFGLYQRVVYFTLCIMSIPTAWHSLGNTFLSASPDHQCRLYEGYTYNASKAHDEVRNCSIPKLEDGNWDSCKMYANASQPYSECNVDELGQPVPCEMGWVYDRTVYKETAVSQVMYE